MVAGFTIKSDFQESWHVILNFNPNYKAVRMNQDQILNSDQPCDQPFDLLFNIALYYSHSCTGGPYICIS